MGEIRYSDIADYFIALSNVTGNLITNLKLQKLVYYTQAWHLALFDKPLFKGNFEAWVHGPVLPELYDDYKIFSWRPIERDDLNEDSLKNIKEEFGKDTAEFIDELVNEYFGLTGYELERLTHMEEPWIKARAGLPSDMPSANTIKKDWMKDFYKQYLNNG